jgi:hypothetical protein
MCNGYTIDWNAVLAITTIALTIVTGIYVKITHDISKAASEAPQLAYDLGLKSEREKHGKLLEELTDGLDLLEVPREGNHFAMRVANRTDHPLHKVSALITMDYALTDILRPQGFKTWIDGGHLVPLVEDRVCWSQVENGKNIAVIDIFAQEEQPISLFGFDERQTCRAIDQEKASRNIISSNAIPYFMTRMIKVSSGDGYGDIENDPSHRARVALVIKTYKFWIKIVGENIRAKVWECEFSANTQAPVVKKIKEINIQELRDIQHKLRQREDLSTMNLSSL